MHAVVMERLEEYLAGALEPAPQREIEAHLGTCATCREEIRGMQDVSQLFDSLRDPEVLDVSPGFYARVLAQVEARQAERPSWDSWFGLSMALGRRMAFASLLTLVLLVGYLATHDPEVAHMRSPEAIFAEQESPSFDAAPAHDNMLVTLTAYEQR